jgi:hypothetical protein
MDGDYGVISMMIMMAAVSHTVYKPSEVGHSNLTFLCLFVCYIRAAAKAAVALLPSGILCALFSRSSHCRRQMSPRPTRSERSKRREG